MSPLIFLVMRCFWQYIKYFFRSKHWRGYGVHSPYMFYLVTMIIEDKNSFYRFSQIENMRKILKKTTKKIKIEEGGVEKEVGISSLLKKGVISPTYDQLLFRLIKFFHPKNILEIGTSAGVTSMYMAAPYSDTKVCTVENQKEVAKLARLSFQRAEFHNIEVYNPKEDGTRYDKKIKETDFDLYYFGRESTVAEIKEVLTRDSGKFTGNTVIIMSDIYKSEEKELLWSEMKQIRGVRVSLELFFYGILIFNEDLRPESYNLFFIPPLFR